MSQNRLSPGAAAIVTVFLGVAAVTIVVHMDSPFKWVLALPMGAAMLAFLVPVLRAIRRGGDG